MNIASNPEQAIDAVTLTHLVHQELEKKTSHSNPRQVLVKGDQHVDYGKVMQAMVLLQQAGAASVGLITTPPPQEKQS